MTNLRVFKINSSSGFTIVELMIALSVFAIILVTISAALVQIGRAYYRSVFTSRTQAISRSINDNVSRNIQFSASPIRKSSDSIEVGSGDVEVNSICVGKTRYSYAFNNLVGSDEVPFALWRDEIGGTDDCVPADLSDISDDDDGTELLSENMQLLWFSIDQSPSIDRRFRLRIDVAYGESNHIEGVDSSGAVAEEADQIVRYRCAPSGLTLQFCAVTSLTTTISRRL